MDILVIGCSKTGTTGLSRRIRYCLAGRTGYALEPKPENKATLARLRNDEWDNRVVKILFDHWANEPDALDEFIIGDDSYDFTKRVAIRRDIRDELISRMLYLPYVKLCNDTISQEQYDQFINVVREKESNPQGVSFVKFVEKVSAAMGVNCMPQIRITCKNKMQYEEFLDRHSGKFHIIEYDALIANDFSALSEYLKVPIKQAEGEDKALGHIKRTAASGNWRRFFTPEDVKFLRPQLDEILARDDRVQDWRLESCDRLPSEHYSKYVERLAKAEYDSIKDNR